MIRIVRTTNPPERIRIGRFRGGGDNLLTGSAAKIHADAVQNILPRLEVAQFDCGTTCDVFFVTYHIYVIAVQLLEVVVVTAMRKETTTTRQSVVSIHTRSRQVMPSSHSCQKQLVKVNQLDYTKPTC